MVGGIFNRLSDKACKAFAAQKAHGKKLSDGGGLYLLITPSGSASWRIKYRVEGKEKTYSIGNYPDVSLAAARVEIVKALYLGARLLIPGSGPPKKQQSWPRVF